MSKSKKNTILALLTGIIIISVIIILFSRTKEKEELFQKMRAKTELIDSTFLSVNEAYEELRLINKDVWKKIDKPIETISTFNNAKSIIFINNDLGEGFALVSIIRLSDVKAGMDLSEFHPQFKEYNSNKIKGIKTLKINRESINALQKFLKKNAVLFYKFEILGDYTYIINIVG